MLKCKLLIEKQTQQINDLTYDSQFIIKNVAPLTADNFTYANSLNVNDCCATVHSFVILYPTMVISININSLRYKALMFIYLFLISTIRSTIFPENFAYRYVS